MFLHIVILSGRSLFSEGVASRMREYPQRVDVHFVDPQQPDYIDHIHAIRPAAILVDAADTNKLQCELLCDLLMSLANVMVIRLDVHKNDIQIVTSVQRPLKELRELIEIVEQFSHLLG